MSLCEAAWNGSLGEVRALIARGSRASERDAHGCPAIVSAAKGRYDGTAAEVIQELLRCGADVDATDSFGRTAIMYVARRGHRSAFRTLLAGGAAVGERTVDVNGMTTLHHVGLGPGKSPILDDLRWCIKDFRGQTRESPSSWLQGVESGLIYIVERGLIYVLTTQNTTDNDGRTPVNLAPCGRLDFVAAAAAEAVEQRLLIIVR